MAEKTKSLQESLYDLTYKKEKNEKKGAVAEGLIAGGKTLATSISSPLVTTLKAELSPIGMMSESLSKSPELMMGMKVIGDSFSAMKNSMSESFKDAWSNRIKEDKTGDKDKSILEETKQTNKSFLDSFKDGWKSFIDTFKKSQPTKPPLAKISDTNESGFSKVSKSIKKNFKGLIGYFKKDDAEEDREEKEKVALKKSESESAEGEDEKKLSLKERMKAGGMKGLAGIFKTFKWLFNIGKIFLGLGLTALISANGPEVIEGFFKGLMNVIEWIAKFMKDPKQAIEDLKKSIQEIDWAEKTEKFLNTLKDAWENVIKPIISSIWDGIKTGFSNWIHDEEGNLDWSKVGLTAGLLTGALALFAPGLATTIIGGLLGFLMWKLPKWLGKTFWNKIVTPTWKAATGPKEKDEKRQKNKEIDKKKIEEDKKIKSKKLDVGKTKTGLTDKLKNFKKVLPKIGKFVPGAGVILTAGMAIKDAYEGFTNAEAILGKDKGTATLADKLITGTTGLIEGATFGLVNSEKLAKNIVSIKDNKPTTAGEKGDVIGIESQMTAIENEMTGMKQTGKDKTDPQTYKKLGTNLENLRKEKIKALNSKKETKPTKVVMDEIVVKPSGIKEQFGGRDGKEKERIKERANLMFKANPIAADLFHMSGNVFGKQGFDNIRMTSAFRTKSEQAKAMGDLSSDSFKRNYGRTIAKLGITDVGEAGSKQRKATTSKILDNWASRHMVGKGFDLAYPDKVKNKKDKAALVSNLDTTLRESGKGWAWGEGDHIHINEGKTGTAATPMQAEAFEKQLNLNAMLPGDDPKVTKSQMQLSQTMNQQQMTKENQQMSNGGNIINNVVSTNTTDASSTANIGAGPNSNYSPPPTTATVGQ